MKKLILLIGTLCILTLGGCQSVSSTAPEPSSVTETNTTESVQTTEKHKPVWTEENELELYNTYINVYNYMANNFTSSLNSYFEYVDYQEEFILLNDNKDYSISSISETFIEDMELASRLAEGKDEKSKVDEAYIQMYPILTKLTNCLNEIGSYTEMKSYFDDDYEKGKEQHSILWTTLSPYTEAADLFGFELQTAEFEKRGEYLQTLKDEGLDTLYAINIVMDSGQAIQEELYIQEITDANILDMDIEKIQPLYDEFTKNVDELLVLMEDEDALTEEGIFIQSTSLYHFNDSMRNAKLALTQVIGKVKEGTPLSDYDIQFSHMNNNTLASFESALSSMIDNYNQLIQN